MTDPFAMPWLVPPPDDLRIRTRALRTSEPFDLPGLRALVRTALDTTQLERIGRILTDRTADLAAIPGIRRARLGIVASHTATLLAQALPAAAFRHDLLLSVHLADFGQAAQDILDPQSALSQAGLDILLLAFDPHALGLARPCFDPAAAEAAVAGALDYVLSLRTAARRHVAPVTIVQTLVVPAEPLFGSLDSTVVGSVRWLVDRFNRKLGAALADSPDLLFDTAALAATIGLNQWHDARLWHDAKIPVALAAIPLLADRLAALLAASQGLARKCLVLDLDNTLWGGVIGDDGVDGIRIGQGSGAGEAHLALQAYVLDLRRRGIVLAVCSKNEEDAARLPFRTHPDMLLREAHIAVFVANWSDKATNLRRIAADLAIGIDSLVFLDDNPAEREQVRQALPQVAVPEIGSDPADFVRILAQAGYFETIHFAPEDRTRADMYGANVQRTTALQAVGDIGAYLASLAMVCTIRPFDAGGGARIAQLVGKSNQYNLTTRRYTESEITAIAADPTRFAIQVRLADRFGDNGMISVVIFDRGPVEWVCDSWLMSCRVLGRRVEEAILSHVVAAAIAAGATRLIGDYVPTPKNRIVADHFAKLGFTRMAERADGGTRWSLELADFTPPALPIALA